MASSGGTAKTVRSYNIMAYMCLKLSKGQYKM